MRIIDEYGNELLESEPDLTLGYLTDGTAIRADAVPIDDRTKFAWADGDYEQVQVYCLYSDHTDNHAPSQEERIAALEEALELLLSGVTE